jgi:hypothetical protein
MDLKIKFNNWIRSIIEENEAVECRLLNVRNFGRTYRKSSKSNGQNGSNLTEAPV